ncbi:6,7,8-trihydroxycoumarin synthase-like isoform X2 [Coffea arabica]|uniref:6,7,8-trihydroxycoumarin synthase-like isoform X2 n=1 Tax=Coffea arabica TaxID=13443 RepID=A0ABM4URZ7_COFAR
MVFVKNELRKRGRSLIDQILVIRFQRKMAWLFLCSILPLILIFLLQKTKKSKKTRGPPGPPGLPFIGNLHQLDSAKPHEYLWKLSKKYGPLMSLRIGSVPVVVISSSKMAKEALKTHDLVFSGRRAYVSHQKLSYNGRDVAFSPYGEYWRQMRKKYDEEGHERKRFDQILQESQAMMAGFFISDYLPSLSWIDKLSGMFARLEKNFKDLDLFYQELIDEHLNPNRPETMKDDVLDILIQIKQEQSSGFELTWDHIKALLMNIFIAGTDTSAATVVWAMTALMKNPSALKKVQAEIRDLVGQKGAVVGEKLQQLRYLDAVIKEALRLYPPAPVLVARETTQSCNIEGYEIGSKTLVYINDWAISRDPENWERPDEFIPERFLNNAIDVRGNDFEVIPFGAGRRGCPGIHLGLSTVKLALANLLYSFEWELPSGIRAEDIDTDVLPGITMHKKNALCILAKEYLHKSS